MNRFYRSLAVLFLLLFLLSFMYCTAASWSAFKISLMYDRYLVIGKGTATTSYFIKFGLVYGSLTALALFATLALLLRKAVLIRQKFTVRKIIIITAGFFGITTLIAGIYVAWYVNHDHASQIVDVFTRKRNSITRFPYLVFTVAWILYYFLVSLTINKRTDG